MSMGIIEISQLKKTFGEHIVLNGIDLTIHKQDVVAIVGPSGSGKSTLLRCINLLEKPTSGDILFEGRNITRNGGDINKLRAQIGMVFQHFNLFPHLTALQNLTLAPRKALQMGEKEAVALARALLQKVGLMDKADSYPSTLSGGQKQRVAIARALALKPKVIMFDEPTSALDPEMVHEVLQTMSELAEEGMTMIVVTHEMGFARKVANRIIFVDEGKVMCDSIPGDFFRNPPNDRIKKFLDKVLV